MGKTLIGHYGCGRLVKVVTNGRPARYGPAKKYHVDCTACGYDHPVKITWREPIRPREGQEAELRIVMKDQK